MGAQQRTGTLKIVNAHGIYRSRPTGVRARTGERRGHLLIQVPEPVGLFRHGKFGNMKREIEAARPGPSGSLTSKEGKLPTQLSAVQGLSPFPS